MAITGGVLDFQQDCARKRSNARKESKVTEDDDLEENVGLLFAPFSFARSILKGQLVGDNERPFLQLAKEAAIESAANAVFNKWNLKSPDVIISFIGGTRFFKAWNKEDHRAALQNGIVKLVNTANVWIMTNGLHYGIAKLIGDAVRNEHRHRESRQKQEVYTKEHLNKKKTDLVLMGIVPVPLLKDPDVFTAVQGGRIKIRSTGKKHETQHYDMDSYHTHFLILKRSYKASALFRVQLEKRLAKEARMRTRDKIIIPEQSDSDDDHGPNLVDSHRSTVAHHDQHIPLVAILVQGGPVELDQVHANLKNNVPVVIIKGTGFIADILAATLEDYYYEHARNPHELNFLRPEVIKRINRIFSTGLLEHEFERISMRDKILDCIALGCSNSGSVLLTVISSNDDLSNLDDHILMAVFESRPHVASTNIREQIRSDMVLTMQFNKPSLALSKVMARDEWHTLKMDNDLIEKSLLWKNRERFLEYFMEQDFAIHKYLSHSKLLHLFRRAEDAEFFVTVVWEQLLARIIDDNLKESFVTNDLNLVVEELTGIKNFLSLAELSKNAMGTIENETTAERKATNALLVWAVLMNRSEIAKSLWRFCDDPIPLALFLSAMFRNLRDYCPESETASKLQDQSRAFSKMATDVLDMGYRESNARAFELLNQKFPDFNEKTPLKLAYDCENRYFLAHESCQKWLTHIWEGGIEVSGSLERHLIGLPDSIKLILSALFLFPIPFWIQYPRKNFEKQYYKERTTNHFHDTDEIVNSESLDNIQDPYQVDLRNRDASTRRINQLELSEAGQRGTETLANHRHSIIPSSKSRTKTALYIRNELPFYRKVVYLWTAPRTKFWMFQLMYWAYLAVFSVTVLIPTCESMTMDIVIISWTFLMVIEIVLRTIYQVREDFPVDLFERFAEILILSAFVLSAFLLRLVGIYFGLVRPFYSRALMSIGLLYMYYRMIAVFFPMHPTLGPMLYRIKRMLAVDFVSFLKLLCPFLLANTFVLQAVMYPDFPFNSETWRRGFFRAFFTLFTAFLGEIDYSERCEHARIVNQSDYCWTGDYSHHECPTIGWTSYILNIQYMVILKLILVTLLYALFSGTLMKVKEEADYIWKFQRYGIILDFASRPALPPPFSVFSYGFSLFVMCCGKVKGMNGDRLRGLTKRRDIRLKHQNTHKTADTTYNYWMGLTKEYYRTKAQEEKDKRISKDQYKITQEILETQASVKRSITGFRDRLKELEEKCDDNRLYLEEIKQTLERIDNSSDERGKTHRLSRQSPYPGTNIFRFNVFNKFVPWEVPYDLYDPADYSKPNEEFPVSEQAFVDPKLDSRVVRDEGADEVPNMIHDFDEDFQHPLTVYHHPSKLLCWNNVIVLDNKMCIDRRSWTGISQPVNYELNDLGLPKNPMGRTGLSGRGNLHRFGPNHYVQLVITRGMANNMQVVIVKTTCSNRTVRFPKAPAISSEDNLIKVVLLAFVTIFDYSTAEVLELSSATKDFKDLPKVLEKIAFPKHATGGHLLTIRELERGYLDDPENTDNAWIETVTWHIQLNSHREFDRDLRSDFIWEDAIRTGRALNRLDAQIHRHPVLQ